MNWEKCSIQTERGYFEYFKKGKGSALCVTHLYSAYDERGNTFANPFTSHYSVYLVNLKGCGGSDRAKVKSEYGMLESIKDLEAIRKSLQIERWGFAGHSTGGMLALTYAIEYPAALTKIIAGGTCASKEYIQNPKSIYCKGNMNFRRISEIMNALNSPETTQDQRQALGFEWAMMSYYREEKLRESLKIPNSGRTVGARLNYFIQVDCRNYDVRERLSELSIPSYIYAGLHDAQCPYEYGVEIADLIPGSVFRTFEYSNHNPFVEEADAFEEFVAMTK